MQWSHYYTSDTYKRKQEGLETKFTIATNMLKRAVKAGIKADYLLVDSWYSKPIFVKSIKDLGLDIISRITNSPTAWQFSKRDNNKQKTLTGIYRTLSKSVSLKFAKYNKIKYSYCSKILHHQTVGLVKVVFIKTHNKLIPILSTNTKLTDERIIEIYKKRWNIEQGYKELREHFAFGKEENRIYEALIARITISSILKNSF
jgi:SRSO17 transposase